ncbi:MAG: hypothetical protein ABIR47_04135 [Candidatus Kapaibacterium sp.]
MNLKSISLLTIIFIDRHWHGGTHAAYRISMPSLVFLQQRQRRLKSSQPALLISP